MNKSDPCVLELVNELVNWRMSRLNGNDLMWNVEWDP